MRTRLSLPVVAISKIAPKHKAHGSNIASLLPASVIESLGVDLNRTPRERKALGIAS